MAASTNDAPAADSQPTAEVTVEGEDTAAAAEEERLRYLEFVQRAAAQALVLAAVGVDHVEGTVVGRFHLLRLLDRKVGDSC